MSGRATKAECAWEEKYIFTRRLFQTWPASRVCVINTIQSIGLGVGSRRRRRRRRQQWRRRRRRRRPQRWQRRRQRRRCQYPASLRGGGGGVVGERTCIYCVYCILHCGQPTDKYKYIYKIY